MEGFEGSNGGRPESGDEGYSSGATLRLHACGFTDDQEKADRAPVAL